MMIQKRNLSTATTKYVTGMKGILWTKSKTKIKHSRNISGGYESEFIKKLREIIIESIDMEQLIKYFQKDPSKRTKIQTRCILDYLSKNPDNEFFYSLRNINKEKVYNFVNHLMIQKYEPNQIIYEYNETVNQFYMVLFGTVSLLTPKYFLKNIKTSDFLQYLLFLKEKDHKSFARVHKKNSNNFNGMEKFEMNNYKTDIFSNKELNAYQDFYIEKYVNSNEVKAGCQLNKIPVLYNFNSIYNAIAKDEVYLLHVHRNEFLRILKYPLEEELFKEFSRMRKCCYIYNSWNNYNLAQMITLYIPKQLLYEEEIYHQKDNSDSFYIVESGTFDIFCDLSIDDFHIYKKYLMKSNQNVLEWIKLQKSEKNKITRDKIIDLVNEKTKIEKYPEKKQKYDTNLIKVQKGIINQGSNNDPEKIIQLKLNEEALKDKTKTIRVKLCTFKKNDFIGIEDSLEYKSRFYTVQCTSLKGCVYKIQLIDFLVFISRDSSSDLSNLNNYLKERKNFIFQRISKTINKEKENNTRRIETAYTNAFTYFNKNDKPINNNFFVSEIKNKPTVLTVRNFNSIKTIYQKISPYTVTPKIQKQTKNYESNNKDFRQQLTIPNLSRIVKNLPKKLYLARNNRDSKTERIKSASYKNKYFIDTNSIKSSINKDSTKKGEEYTLNCSLNNYKTKKKSEERKSRAKIYKEILNMTGLFNTKRNINKNNVKYPSFKYSEKQTLFTNSVLNECKFPARKNNGFNFQFMNVSRLYLSKLTYGDMSINRIRHKSTTKVINKIKTNPKD